MIILYFFLRSRALLIVKNKNNQPIPEDLRLIIEEKIADIFDDKPVTTICELTLSTLKIIGKDKEIQVTCTLAHIKNPVHISAAAENYYKTIDIAQSKLRRAIHKAKVKSNQA